MRVTSQQCDLSERVVRAKRADVLTVSEDVGFARRDHVGAVASIAWAKTAWPAGTCVRVRCRPRPSIAGTGNGCSIATARSVVEIVLTRLQRAVDRPQARPARHGSAGPRAPEHD